jgi:hypothetical protein
VRFLDLKFAAELAANDVANFKSTTLASAVFDWHHFASPPDFGGRGEVLFPVRVMGQSAKQM